MSGETEKSHSAWTTDTVLAHLLALREADNLRHDSMREANNLRHEQRFEAQEAATKYAQEKANEFRGQLKDQAERFMPRQEAEKSMVANAEKTDAIAARMDRTEGRSVGISAGWGWLVGAVGLAAALISIFLTLRK